MFNNIRRFNCLFLSILDRLYIKIKAKDLVDPHGQEKKRIGSLVWWILMDAKKTYRKLGLFVSVCSGALCVGIYATIC
jgi:hypothetical protein